MFKNVIMFRIQPGWTTSIEQIEEALQQTPFTECGLTQERSFGWVPPRGEAHGALVEAVGGQYILKFMTESKAVPASVLNRKVKERVAQIEATTGRKPGKKESKELKEEAKLTLLPMAGLLMAAWQHLFKQFVAPVAQLAEAARVLAPGGTLAVSFSNRWFPQKAVRLWSELHEFERLGFVAGLLEATPGLGAAETLAERGWPRPADARDRFWPLHQHSDPLYAVTARRMAR